MSVKAGAFVMENVGLSDALDAASAPQRLSSMARLGHLSWEGIDVVAPDKDSGPGKTIHVALGSVDIRNAYQGDLFKDSTMSMKSLVIEPSKGSAMSDSLALFGYSRIEISLRIAAHYDAAAKKLSLGDFDRRRRQCGRDRGQGGFRRCRSRAVRVGLGKRAWRPSRRAR